jgi:hypothetical protein
MMRFISFGTLMLATLVFLGLDGWWISSEAHAPTGRTSILVWQWLAALVILLLAAIISGHLAKKRLIGILIDERDRVSLARFQWVAWFVLLFSAYFAGAIWNAFYGADLPAIEPNLFGTIGVVSGSAVISNLIVDNKKNQEKPATLAADPRVKGVADINLTPDEATWAELFLGEEGANRDTVDVSRLQKLIITFILVIAYFGMLLSGFTQTSLTYESFNMPAVGANFLLLLGASHAAYLAYKATPKTPTPKASTA